jgi:hypothetical protein
MVWCEAKQGIAAIEISSQGNVLTGSWHHFIEYSNLLVMVALPQFYWVEGLE